MCVCKRKVRYFITGESIRVSSLASYGKREDEKFAFSDLQDFIL